MSVNFIRVVNLQTLHRSILIDKVDRSQGNFEVGVSYAQAAKQRVYVPYSNPLDTTVNGYTDFVPTDDVLLSAAFGTIKKLQDTSPPRISVSVVSSALVVTPVVTNAVHSAAAPLGGQTGAAANITTFLGGKVTVTGLTGMTTGSVGNDLVISGAATSANNGTFKITDYVSATSVKVANPLGVASDANNGSINWVEQTEPLTTITGTTFLSVSPDKTYVTLINGALTQTLTDAAIIAAGAPSSFGTTSIVIADSMVTIGTPTTGWKVKVYSNSKLSNIFTLLWPVGPGDSIMRVAAVRTDIGKVYLSDIENRSQRNFSSEPAGQSRYLSKPTDAALLAVLTTYGLLTRLGSDTAGTVDTTVANGTKLNIRVGTSGAYTQVTVTSSATLTKAQVAADLNSAFVSASLPLVARVTAATKIAIDTTSGSSSAHIDISASSPSTGALHTVLGLATGATTGLTVAALKTAVYPTSVTVDVSTGTIAALSTFANLSPTAQAALVTAVADLVAPQLVETGPVLLSFAYGVMSKLRSASFQPGGARVGLPAGVGVAIVANDGSTPYTLLSLHGLVQLRLWVCTHSLSCMMIYGYSFRDSVYSQTYKEI